MAIGRVIVFAKHVEALRHFYETGLGLVTVAAEPGWVRLGGAGAELALHGLPPAIAARVQIASPPVARADTAIKPVFFVADVVAARARLAALGAVMSEVRNDYCDGVDPEGNVFQIAPA
jgi:catechol 2,3-dioxygenase-like lactoylglutathione lyase family enzyme